ncbi:MAG: hypothetical protein IJ538_02640 [Clostridia bacterium]|nr:hypothetical protein [Clostridia bacterium]
MDNNFNGFANNVIKNGDQYSYFFDGEIFHLNRIKEVSGAEFSFEPKQLPILKTTKDGGGAVILFDCIQRFVGRSLNEIDIKPSYLFESKYKNLSFDKFSGIVCYGKWINKLFPPSQIVEYDSLNYDHNKKNFFECVRDGSKIIKLKKWTNVDKKFKYISHGEKIEISFKISSPGTIMPEDEDLGKINSCFELKFSREHSILELKDYYLKIRKFFQFLTNRQDILFDEIYILKKSEKSGFERIGFFYDMCNKNSEIPKSMHKVDCYLSNITKLFKYIGNEKVNFNHIPKNSIEHKYVTPEQYVNCCGSFEYNYKKVIPNVNLDTKTQIVLDDLNNCLLSHTDYNRKQRNIIKKAIKDIQRRVSSVEEKYNNCLKKYNKALNPYLEKISKHFEIAKKPNLLGKHFSAYRNCRAHGELDPFTREAVCAYVVANVIIECLILDACGYNIEEIEQIVKNKY